MEERRRFFRIDDKVGLYFKAISEQEWGQYKDSGIAPTTDSQGLPCPALEQQITDAINSLRQVSGEAAEVAWLLNTKVNGLMELIAEDTALPELVKSMDVNISACGMAFRAMKSLQQNQLLYLEITLKQQEQPLIALAKVVSCSELEEAASLEQFLVRVDFCDIEPDAQELLIQYVVKQQGQLLQQKKHRK
ncbi:PilZ domain-containing protein [Endozoicomonas sp. SM1973]|uniref:PilZ domain-containing protein n=1 Tax=Spartinivicinus marinus TaxID=2994442 RepID=A0A853IED4_9GAMM|nr:PilZ domain-containing protein [Spartinivicinus marinus]MCX4025967.1 PilZ domain-containing protein [Spartinivicinus marinus]NYZ67867.1 PilZ domain-containing protein [Spartinivicinus marinus]